MRDGLKKEKRGMALNYKKRGRASRKEGRL